MRCSRLDLFIGSYRSWHVIRLIYRTWPHDLVLKMCIGHTIGDKNLEKWHRPPRGSRSNCLRTTYRALPFGFYPRCACPLFETTPTHRPISIHFFYPVARIVFISILQLCYLQKKSFMESYFFFQGIFFYLVSRMVLGRISWLLFLILTHRPKKIKYISVIQSIDRRRVFLCVVTFCLPWIYPLVITFIISTFLWCWH